MKEHETEMKRAKPIKTLGIWGVTIKGKVKIGDVVKVRTLNGKTLETTITGIIQDHISNFEGMSICRTR